MAYWRRSGVSAFDSLGGSKRLVQGSAFDAGSHQCRANGDVFQAISTRRNKVDINRCQGIAELKETVVIIGVALADLFPVLRRLTLYRDEELLGVIQD